MLGRVIRRHPCARRGRGLLRPAGDARFPGRLAVVRRGRLPAGLLHRDHAPAPSPAPATFVVAIAWLALHARLALAAMSPAPMTFTTREGFTVALPTRDQVRPLVMLLAAVGVVPDRVVRVEPVDDAAHVVAPGAVRQEPIRCSATTRRSTSSRCRRWSCCAGLLLGLRRARGGRRRSALYFVAGQVALTPFGLRIDERARRHLHLARGRVLPGARARRVARAACRKSCRRRASSRAPATPTRTRACRRRSP